MFFRRRIDLAQQPFSRGSACLGRKNCTCLHVILQRTRSVSNCPAAGVPCLIGLNLVGSPMTKELFQICTELMPKYFGVSVGKTLFSQEAGTKTLHCQGQMDSDSPRRANAQFCNINIRIRRWWLLVCVRATATVMRRNHDFRSRSAAKKAAQKATVMHDDDS